MELCYPISIADVMTLMLPQYQPPPPPHVAPPQSPPPLPAPILMVPLTIQVTPPRWAPHTPPSTKTIHQYCLRKWHLDPLVFLFASIEVGYCNAYTLNH